MRTLSKGMEITSLQQRSQIFMWVFMNRPLRILTLGLKQLQFLTGALILTKRPLRILTLDNYHHQSNLSATVNSVNP